MKMRALFVWRAENPLSFNGQRPREDGGTDQKMGVFFQYKKSTRKKTGAAFKQVGPKRTVIRSPAPVYRISVEMYPNYFHGSKTHEYTGWALQKNKFEVG